MRANSPPPANNRFTQCKWKSYAAVGRPIGDARARVCTKPAFQSADCVKRDQMGPMPVENEAGVLTPAPVDIALALE